jgi:hypothetical protein
MSSNFATKIVGANPAEKRSEMDFYPTPPEATEALLRFLDLPKDTFIWEPACGEMDMAYVMMNAGYSVCATDLKYGQDFLTEPLHSCDWIITNPPFTVADKFIKRCVEHGKPFAMLLKSQYWHAKKRYDLFYDTPPAYVCPLTWRPDFLFKKHETKKSPLMDVMWCVWIPGRDRTVYMPLAKPGGGFTE